MLKEVYKQEQLKTMIEEQELSLFELNIEPIEKYVSRLVGMNIKFNKTLKRNKEGQPYLHLETVNLVNKAGVFKVIVNNVRVSTDVGYSSFNSGREKGIITEKFRFTYEFVDGGKNVSRFGMVKFNPTNRTWEGENLKTSMFEVIH